MDTTSLRQKIVEAIESGMSVGEIADYILNSLTVSSGGGKCDMCNGHGKILPYQLDNGSYIYKDDCLTCNGTGQKPIVTKTLGEIIKEWEDD